MTSFERLENYFLSISYSTKARYTILACISVAVIMFLLFIRVQTPIKNSLDRQEKGLKAIQEYNAWIEETIYFSLQTPTANRDFGEELRLEEFRENAQKMLSEIKPFAAGSFLLAELDLHESALQDHWQEIKKHKLSGSDQSEKSLTYFLEMAQILIRDIAISSDLFFNIDRGTHELIIGWNYLYRSIKQLSISIHSKKFHNKFDIQRLKLFKSRFNQYLNSQIRAFRDNEVLSTFITSKELAVKTGAFAQATKKPVNLQKANALLQDAFILQRLTGSSIKKIISIQAHSLFIQRAIGWVCICFGVGTVLCLYMTKVIRHPLLALKKGVSDLARGDLSSRIEIVSHDEVADMSRAFNSMASLFEEILIHAGQITSDLADTSSQLFSTSKELEENVMKQEGMIKSISQHAKQISETVGDFAETLKEVNKTAATTTQLASLGKASISDMEQTLKTMMEASLEMVKTLSELKEKVSSINHVIQAIVEIADESNLLSLNTAIKAGKTGGKGAGFAIVASKIRELANQTASLTLDVEDMVKQIVDAVSEAVLEVDHFYEQIRTQVEDANSIGDQLKNLVDHAQEQIQTFERISAGMQAQTEGVAEIHEGLLLQQEASKKTTHSISKLYREIEYLYHATSNLFGLTKKFTFSSTSLSKGASKSKMIFPDTPQIPTKKPLATASQVESN